MLLSQEWVRSTTRRPARKPVSRFDRLRFFAAAGWSSRTGAELAHLVVVVAAVEAEDVRRLRCGLEWLDRDRPRLMSSAGRNPQILFIVTFGHRPAYSSGYHHGESQLASILDTFGDRYAKYVLNINGPSHNYERFSPIHHVVHVTSGGGGASLEPLSSSDRRTAFRALHLIHLRVDVTPQRMRLEAVCGPATSKDQFRCNEGDVVELVHGGRTLAGDRGPKRSAGLVRRVPLPGSHAQHSHGSADQYEKESEHARLVGADPERGLRRRPHSMRRPAAVAMRWRANARSDDHERVRRAEFGRRRDPLEDSSLASLPSDAQLHARWQRNRSDVTCSDEPRTAARGYGLSVDIDSRGLGRRLRGATMR
jgi:hypothetical protein